MPDRPLQVSTDPAARRAFTMHERIWKQNRYVYPVVSRRSKGVSIGINLNPDKACNFDCIYCSVDRRQASAASRDIDLAVLRAELAGMLGLAFSGELFGHDPFDKIPAPLRRINDIAFSGDGEPTTCPQFEAAVRLASELAENLASKNGAPDGKPGRLLTPADPVFSAPQNAPYSHAGLDPAAPWPSERIKLVLITNATMFHKPAVRETLAFLDEHHGEIWAKLDAGTPGYYQLVDRTNFPFARVLENLRWCCQTRPTVVQSLFMHIRGESPAPEEIAAYAGCLADIANSGGTIKLVQLYTVARRPAEDYCMPLTANELENLADHIKSVLPQVPVEIYP